jgi:multisubunit Na+/H+ antiporter MnhE subunit
VTGANEPPPGTPRRQQQPSLRQRATSWLAWWVLLMGLWVAVDDSIGLAELGAGAAVAALAALLTEVALHQAGLHPRLRLRWLASAYRLPGQVLGDTVVVFRALARQLVRGQDPPSGFRELPVQAGDDSTEGVTRRVLLVGASSLAPNTVVLGIDTDRDVMVVHQLRGQQGEGTVTGFVVAAIVMLAAVVPCGVVLCRGKVMEAVVAYEVISSIAVMVLILLAQGFQRPALFELPVLLAVLLLGSGLVFVRALERWL